MIFMNFASSRYFVIFAARSCGSWLNAVCFEILWILNFEHSFCFWDRVDLASLKFLLLWDPGDLGPYGSWILNFCFLVGSWRSWILIFLVLKWDPKFLFFVRSWRSWILTKWFSVESCRSWIVTFYLVVGSCGSRILIFGCGTCLGRSGPLFVSQLWKFV